jgi:hypothetical protein
MHDRRQRQMCIRDRFLTLQPSLQSLVSWAEFAHLQLMEFHISVAVLTKVAN